MAELASSQIARLVGLVFSVLAVLNITCREDLVVNSQMPPNLSTVMANGRGGVFLLIVSVAQVVFVPLTHCLGGKPDYGCIDEENQKNLDIIVRLNICIWSACSLALVFVVLVPLDLGEHPILADTPTQLTPLPPSTGCHCLATMILFAIPLAAACLQTYAWDMGKPGSNLYRSTLFAQLTEFFSLAVLMIFQLLNGFATEHLGGWAMLCFDIELVAIGLLLAGGVARLQSEPGPCDGCGCVLNLAAVVVPIVIAMASVAIRAVQQLGWDLGATAPATRAV